MSYTTLPTEKLLRFTLVTLPTTLPLSLTAPYRCHHSNETNELGMDWEPVDEYVAIPVEHMVTFLEDYDTPQAVALMLAAVEAEFPAALDGDEIDSDVLDCSYATLGWLQAAGYVTLDVDAA